MARRPSPTIADPAQPSFFDLRPPTNLGELDGQVREALGEVLASAKARLGLDRHAVAAEVNRLQPLAERELTKNVLDRCCAPSSAEWQLPAWRVPALCRVTEDYRLLTLLVDACGHKAVPNEAAALGELMLLELEERRLRERKEALRRTMPQGARDWAAREAARRAG